MLAGRAIYYQCLMPNSRGSSGWKEFWMGCFDFSTFMNGKLQRLTSSQANIGVLSFPSKVLLSLSKLLNFLAQIDKYLGQQSLSVVRLTLIIFWPDHALASPTQEFNFV